MRLKRDDFTLQIPFPQKLTSDPTSFHRRIEAQPFESPGRKAAPELDRLSNIIKKFNDTFGTLFLDANMVARRLHDDIAPKVALDKAYLNARENTPHTARLACDNALRKVMQGLLRDDTQTYKQFVENEAFRPEVSDLIYELTSN